MAPSVPYDASGKRGEKRKRPSIRQLAVKQESQAEVIAKKLHHGIHEARKAAKKAEAFEVRKLVKRLKAARSQSAQVNVKSDDPAEMEKQLQVLKHADHEQFGNTALRTKILKDGLLSKNEDVKRAVEDKLSEDLVAPQEPGSSAAKVHARLLSSKILADAVHTVVNTLREVLNPESVKKDRTGAEESDEESEAAEEEISGQPKQGGKVKAEEASDDEDEEDEDAESGSQVDADDAAWESGTIDGGDDGAGVDWESGSIDDDGDIAVANSSDDDDDGESESFGDSEVESDAPPAKKAKPSATDVKGNSKPGAASTFLPSLSVGFTRGDSDASDFSEGEAAGADAPRKNRRGQRARRAIWEKKYGRNANHVKKQHEAQARAPRPQQQKGRPYGGPAERGARKFQAAGGAPRQGRDAGYGKTNADGVTRGPGQTLGASRHVGSSGPETKNAGAGGGRSGKGAQGETPLHPSWEAKKRLKEKLNPGIRPAQGKKITFS
ncbi:Bud-site selection protein [Dichomitus squalens]|uniref:Bud-site selection protein n=1 Tax=Dichomitus squalens TaxID=114155 RepID=A0A4Q9MQ52_9APHY|nr:Bud-site selection protein [Dichomitus squalens]